MCMDLHLTHGIQLSNYDSTDQQQQITNLTKLTLFPNFQKQYF